MRIFGIHYMSEGLHWTDKREEDFIRDFTLMREAGFNAIRLCGYDDLAFRLSKLADKMGFEVWLNPKHIFVNGKDRLLSYPNYLRLMKKFAKKAKESKVDVFTVGNELSLEISDLLNVRPSYRWRATHWDKFFRNFANNPIKLRNFVSKLTHEAKKNFSGTVTYAAGDWEWNAIDWSEIDIVSVNRYTHKNVNMDWYSLNILGMKGFGKPAVMTEFGFQTFNKALEAGGNWAYDEVHKVEYDESTQAKLLVAHIKLFKKLGLDGWFIHQWQELKDTGFGLVKSDGKLKKSYNEIKRLIKNRQI